MTFERKYTDKMILDVFVKYNDIVAVRQVVIALGCSKLTAMTRLKDLLRSGKVKRGNIGTNGKPAWIYSIK